MATETETITWKKRIDKKLPATGWPGGSCDPTVRGDEPKDRDDAAHRKGLGEVEATSTAAHKSIGFGFMCSRLWVGSA